MNTMKINAMKDNERMYNNTYIHMREYICIYAFGNVKDKIRNIKNVFFLLKKNIYLCNDILIILVKKFLSC